jgi:hypothetical protein
VHLFLRLGDPGHRFAFPRAVQRTSGQDAQTEDAPSQGVQAPAPRHKRIVTVTRPGVKPEGPDQISYEEWDILGREVGAACPRVKEFLRRLDA